MLLDKNNQFDIGQLQLKEQNLEKQIKKEFE